jgi:hypothetical protein
MKPARIETEKILVGETPCRRILGFQGVLNDEGLPDSYMSKAPSFALMTGGSKDGDHGHVWSWNGRGYDARDVSKGTPVIILNFPEKHEIPGLHETEVCICIYARDILREDTFQAILVWLKRAGGRLGKIRKNEKAGWSGKETVTI